MKHILITTLAILWAATQLVAQDLIVPKKGNPITAYNIDASGSFIYYTAESDANAALQRIAKDSVLMVRKADGTVMDFAATSATSQSVPATVEKPKTDYPIIDEADIHGSLIAQGNKVFIPTDSDCDAGRAGQEQLKKRVQEWDYWTVVDKLDQAHFVLQFHLKTDGQDVAYMVIRPRKYYRENPLFYYGLEPVFQGKTKGGNAGICLWAKHSDDSSPQLNVAIANTFFESLKEVLINPNCVKKGGSLHYKGVSLFYNKKVQQRLDADNETNDACMLLKPEK